jgi:metal-responsive CopG/Arc/MetJ family transcriptional regulator
MKTAISIPDDVFAAAEAAARRTGMSRSQLYVEAVKLFLLKHGDRGITERLDEVHSKAESKVDPVLSAMQIATMRARDSW